MSAPPRYRHGTFSYPKCIHRWQGAAHWTLYQKGAFRANSHIWVVIRPRVWYTQLNSTTRKLWRCFMNEREKIIRLWFDMWIKKADLGIDNIFTDDVVYTESWSPKYENRKTVKHWFDEWNTRGSVLVWEIKQFFHQGNQTIVEWYFKNKMNNGNVEEFDGISLIVWTQDNKIKSLKEFGCNLHNYNPYRDSDIPVFREEKANWF